MAMLECLGGVAIYSTSVKYTRNKAVALWKFTQEVGFIYAV